MIQTLFVYITLTITMAILCHFAAKEKKWGLAVFAVLIYSVIFGLRYGVGADFFGYKNIYEHINYANDTRFEPGIIFIMKILSSLNLPTSFFFGLVAFLQLFLVFLAIKQYKYIYLPICIAFMLDCDWLFFSNGLRQIIALCVFIYSIQFIQTKKIIPYIFCIGIAYLFHKSALILLLLYPLLTYKNIWIKSITKQLILLGISLVIMNVDFISSFINHFDNLLELSGYDIYTTNENFEDNITAEKKIGIGFFINLLIHIVLIINSNNVKEKFKSTWMPILYNLFFLGVIWKYAFLSSQLLQRINYYFIGTQFIIIAFTLCYLKMANKKHIYYLLWGLLCLVFIATMYRMEQNTALYIFNWQSNLFYLKDRPIF